VKILFLLINFCSAVFFYAGETIQNEPTAEHVKPQHHDYGIIPPPGFEYAPEIPGFTKSNTDMKIAFSEMPVAYVDMTADMEKSVADMGGVIIEQFTLNGAPGMLIEVVQKSSDPSSHEDRYSLTMLWDAKGSTLNITANVPISSNLKDALISSFKTLAHMNDLPTPSVDAQQLLDKMGISLDPGALLYGGTMMGIVYFNETGENVLAPSQASGKQSEAQFTIRKLPVQTTIEEWEATLKRKATLRDKEPEPYQSTTVNGYPARELIRENGEELKYILVIFSEDSNYELSARAKSNPKGWLVKFKAVAASIKLK